MEWGQVQGAEENAGVKKTLVGTGLANLGDRFGGSRGGLQCCDKTDVLGSLGRATN